MINTIKRLEYTYKGRRVILDTAQLSPNCYETMIFYASSYMDIDSMTAKTEAEALQQFGKILATYPADKKAEGPAPLAGKYAKLRDDLKKALEAGRKAEKENPEDGGTCNFDSASLYLPRWIASKVEQAAEESGTHAHIWESGIKRFIFSPDTRGQANARSRNAKAMTEALRAMGYCALDFCQMD